MTRDEWLKQFTAELVVLRPHLGPHHALSVALITYGAMANDADPRQSAREYHARRERGEMSFPVKRGRRSK